jgi:hypothetical protein
VQWKVAGAEPISVDLTATTAGLTTDWEFDIDESVNANQCGGGANSAVCGEWVSGGTGGGFGPIASSTTYSWTFDVDWAELLGIAEAGNIRAAFNTSDGKNFNIFSPGGGTFNTTTTEVVTTTTQNIPEPTILTLLGAGLVAASRRLRRRRTA